jgi:TolB protein
MNRHLHAVATASPRRELGFFRRALCATSISLTVVACAAPLCAGEPPDESPVAPRRLTHDGAFKHRPVWSPDGARLLFARELGDKIHLVELDVAVGQERRVTEHEPPEYQATYSPDGRRLAFARLTLSGTQGDVDVFALDVSGGEAVPLARTEGSLSHEEWPAWSPDGSQVAFTTTRYENQEVAVVAADGTGETRLTNQLGIDAHPCWSPDGGQIAFATDRWGGLEIAVMQADGSEVRRLTDARGLDDYPAWSPDGQKIAFVSNRDGNYEVYVMSADGTAPTNLTRSPGTDTFPSWTPDGRGVTLVSQRDDGFDVFVIELP